MSGFGEEVKQELTGDKNFILVAKNVFLVSWDTLLGTKRNQKGGKTIKKRRVQAFGRGIFLRKSFSIKKISCSFAAVFINHHRNLP